MHTPTTIPELKRVLDEAGVLPRFYSFDSDGFDDCFRLAEFHDELGRGWHYYFAERGHRNDLVTLRSEAEACAWFLERILRDSGVYARGTVLPNHALQRTGTGGGAVSDLHA